MKTSAPCKSARLAAVVFGSALLAMIPATLAADIPDQASTRFGGMYKITASNDPVFPMNSNQEWFLDFGQGISAGKTSGSVAVSLRQNPNVRVRIMAWEYFPKQGTLVLGNPYAEGSRQAVAKGSWSMNQGARGVTFDRGSYQIVMTRAAASDY